MQIKKDELIGAYAQSIGIETARELINKKIADSALENREIYTGEEVAKICGELVNEGGLIRIVARNLLVQLERKRAEEQALLLDNIETQVWYLTDVETYGVVNKARADFLGMKKEDLEGKKLWYTLSREEAKACLDYNKAVFQEKKQIRIEQWLKNGEGETRALFIVKTPKLDDNGNIEYLICTAHDITERKRMETEKKKLETMLRQAQKMEAIGTLAGGIAHDFNNILFPILGYSEMLLNDAPDDSDLKHDLNVIFNGAERARDLVKQILAFSRQREYELKPLKLHLIVKEALKLIKAVMPATIDIKQNISKDCGLVMADYTQIHQVAMNLFTNAYHAMEEKGGKLNITLKEVDLRGGDLRVDHLKNILINPGTYVCITVSDTGIGMDQNTIDRIFDPYFTTKKEGKGTGLGLAVVHGIIKSHGGHVSVYSEPDKGTELHVYLPVIKNQQKTGQINTRHIEKGNERILVVDDQKMIIEIQQKMLKRLGYNVTALTSSLEALKTFQANPDNFDLIITDMTMPSMTGDQLAKKIMAIRTDIPIILCTGFSEKMSNEKAESLGIKDFLMKPVLLNDLSLTIRRVLDNK
ncbi:MAG: response regulator [Thermodesulfobacteriota bacterium]|nr:response regulator [Thermodesulfobacteriota bacterium]